MARNTGRGTRIGQGISKSSPVVGSAASAEVLTNEQLDERIRRLMQDLSAIHPEMTAALENAIWLRYGIDL